MIWYKINWLNQAANVIQKLKLIFLMLSISGTEIAGGTIFYK